MRGGLSNQIRRQLQSLALVLAAGLVFAPSASAQWVMFFDETETRLVVEPGLGVHDPAEKAYAWGDVDKDGDIDLAVARKEPVRSSGKRVNVLFINELGALTDRTAEFATDSDIAGDLGFKTPTYDRDIIMVDVDLDGWLDLVTATGKSPDDPKHIAYPRVYHNKCCSVGGCAATTCTTEAWLGFEFEDARIPPLLTRDGRSGFSPCFTAAAAGDVSGDGYPDLYFSDNDEPGCPGDFSDKLLLNQGASQPGYFVDATAGSFIGQAAKFPLGHHGLSCAIDKFNQDGQNDILSQNEANVGIAYNAGGGQFNKSNSVYTGAAYFAAHGDLNNDDRLDLVVADDGLDRYLLNQGDGGDGMADFLVFSYKYNHFGSGGAASDDGFGGNAIVAELDNDGFQDVLITDVDFSVAGCDRRMHIFRNLGGAPGSSVTLEEQTMGSGCKLSDGYPPSCLVASIPASELKGTHDVAVFDIDGDGWNDLVVGRCAGTAVYLNGAVSSPGAVPNGAEVAGPMLLLDKSSGEIQLEWGSSCAPGDTDYTLYQGSLTGAFAGHVPLVCSTGGMTTITLPMGIGPSRSYFLVAPRNEFFQGSLGTTSQGTPRPAGPAPCLPGNGGACQ